MRPGIVLRFHGRTTSPFHSTRQEFSNLVKCAPYILGSTIRGALLKRLIERRACPHLDALNAPHDDAELAEIHRDCELHPFFPASNAPPRAWFSFGRFIGDDGAPLSSQDLATRYRAQTRIGLERAARSVAEGAIVTIESIAPETRFAFEIVLMDDAQKFADALEDAARATGAGEGWGRLRSIGLGQFEIEQVERQSVAAWIADRRAEWQIAETPKALTIEFTTPYVVSRGDASRASLDASQFAERLRHEIAAVLDAVGAETFAGTIEQANLTIRPEFVSLYSYERAARQNSLVSLEGSWAALRCAGDAAEIARALSLAGALGVGEWSTRGFGRFVLANGERRHKRHGAYLPRKGT